MLQRNGPREQLSDYFFPWLEREGLEAFQLAQIDIVNHKEEAAIERLRPFCIRDQLATPGYLGLESDGDGVPDADRPLALPDGVVVVQRVVCGALENLERGIDVFGYKRGAIAPLQYADYEKLLDSIAIEMRGLEDKRDQAGTHTAGNELTAGILKIDESFMEKQLKQQSEYVKGLRSSITAIDQRMRGALAKLKETEGGMRRQQQREKLLIATMVADNTVRDSISRDLMVRAARVVSVSSTRDSRMTHTLAFGP